MLNFYEIGVTMSNYFPPTGNITGSNPSPPYGVITPTNHGPYVVIPDYIMMSLMIVVVISRGLTLSMTNRPLVHHDYIIPAATVRAKPLQQTFDSRQS